MLISLMLVTYNNTQAPPVDPPVDYSAVTIIGCVLAIIFLILIIIIIAIICLRKNSNEPRDENTAESTNKGSVLVYKPFG